MLVPRYGVKNRTLRIPLSELVSAERLTNSENIRLLLCGLGATDSRWRQKKQTKTKKSIKHNVTCQELEKYLDGFHFSQPEHKKIIIIIIISAAKPNLCWSEDHETSEMFFFFFPQYISAISIEHAGGEKGPPPDTGAPRSMASARRPPG